MKILIAEDEHKIGFMYEIILKAAGHSVTLTSDGEQCLNAYKSALNDLPDKSEQYLAQYPPFDVVILDVRMPKIDGREATVLIRQINPIQRIIFVTAYAKLAESFAEIPDGIELLVKPVDLDILVKVVQGQKRPFLAAW